MKKTGQIRAVGYIRVSTDMQAQEGVSLEAQKLRIQSHCTAMDIKLVDIITDAGASAKTLDRPGIQAALTMLRQGRADALIVLKLDRLTRSVKDLGTLCESYFGDGKPWSLLAVSDSIDTRSASGKLILNVLTSVAQWEREAIADRVRDAMQHMKEQGVFLGGAPYGWKYSDEVDAHGRRKLVENREEQAGIRRICELYETDLYVWQICKQLDAEGISSRGPHWHRATVYRILRRAGYEDPDRRPQQSAPVEAQRPAPRKTQVLTNARAKTRTIIRDKAVAARRACELRAEGLSLRQIGERLRAESYLPPRGEIWHAASVLDLLRSAAAPGAGE